MFLRHGDQNETGGHEMSITEVGRARLEQKQKILKWYKVNRKFWDDETFLKDMERRKKLAFRMQREGLYSPKTQRNDLIRSQAKFIAEIRRTE
jgi:hypothetical protein